MKRQIITVSGGFHNCSPITLHIKGGAMSVGQYKRLEKHMCGVDRCICGWRGFDIVGIDRTLFSEMKLDVSYKRFVKQSYR